MKQSALVYTAKLDSLRQSYTFYSSGSLTFHKADNREYSQLLSRLFASSSEVLENKEAAGNRIVVDGTRMAFDITTKEASRTVYAHSPSPASHPLLYAFVHETLDLFRQRNSSSLYSQQRTNGY